MSSADILDHLNGQCSLYSVLLDLSAMVKSQNLYAFEDRIAGISRNYQLMLDYMARGYADDNRQKIYEDIRLSAYQLAQDIGLDERIHRVASYSDAWHRCKGSQFDEGQDSIRQHLENYVAGMAMLSLEPEQQRDIHRRRLLVDHDVYMSRLFDWIVVSPQWTEATGAFYRSLLTSPAIDAADAQWIVSAVSLSCVNMMDVYKLQLLADVYTTAEDEALRQRALVGWALSLDSRQQAVLSRQQATVRQVVSHDGGDSVLIELQVQLLASLNAKYDEACIKRDIMPTLLRQGKVDLTELGKDITASADISEILHPDHSEQAMAEVEDAMERMRKMAAKGRDIYYGGFAQAKRFGFFTQLSHWFEPFLLDHPAIEYGQDGCGDMRVVIGNMTARLPFCDNDKYSFAILFSKMLYRLPEPLRRAIIENQNGLTATGGDELTVAASLRLNSLRDWFRFAQLYSATADFVNPFYMRGTDRANIFLAEACLFGENGNGMPTHAGYGDKVYEMLRFLDSIDDRKNSHYVDTIRHYIDADMPGLKKTNLLFRAVCHAHYGDRQKAEAIFSQWMENGEADERILRAAGRFYLEERKMRQALRCYELLAAKQPGNMGYLINRALCQMETGQTEAAMPTVYKLYYEHPDNRDVQRVRLWGLLWQGQYAQAVGDYAQLCGQEDAKAEDWLNYGYALWLSGEVRRAVDVFRTCVGKGDAVHSQGESCIRHLFAQDDAFLSSRVSVTDMELMADLVEMSDGDL